MSKASGFRCVPEDFLANQCYSSSNPNYAMLSVFVRCIAASGTYSDIVCVKRKDFVAFGLISLKVSVT